MDKILERAGRHQNWLFAILIGIVGLFVVALVMSQDWGTAAQALGNIIGAAIGTIGAAAAIVWQMGKHDRQRATELRNLRRAALRHIAHDLFYLGNVYEEAAQQLVNGHHREAVRTLQRTGVRHFVIDAATEIRLRDFAPGDEVRRDELKNMQQRVFDLINRIALDTDVPPQSVEMMAICIDAFAEMALEYILAADGGLVMGNVLIVTFEYTRSTVARVPGFSKFSRIDWLFA